MKKKLSRAARLFSLGLLITCCSARTGEVSIPADPAGEERAIREVLRAQEVAWNEGSIETFMQGYWKSDSLRFIGNDVTLGWQSTLDGYLRRYPDRATMGELRFEFYRFHFIDADACLVTGRYTLKRASDAPTGMFTLLLKKMDGKWRIVYDHTS